VANRRSLSDSALTIWSLSRNTAPSCRPRPQASHAPWSREGTLTRLSPMLTSWVVLSRSSGPSTAWATSGQAVRPIRIQRRTPTREDRAPRRPHGRSSPGGASLDRRARALLLSRETGPDLRRSSHQGTISECCRPCESRSNKDMQTTSARNGPDAQVSTKTGGAPAPGQPPYTVAENGGAECRLVG
jgi:hypothetical protein